jgi:hypothetical protein
MHFIPSRKNKGSGYFYFVFGIDVAIWYYIPQWQRQPISVRHLLDW